MWIYNRTHFITVFVKAFYESEIMWAMGNDVILPDSSQKEDSTSQNWIRFLKICIRAGFFFLGGGFGALPL